MNKLITTPLIILYVIISLASIIYTLQNIIDPQQITAAPVSAPSIIDEQSGELYFYDDTSHKQEGNYCATTIAMMYCKTADGKVYQTTKYWSKHD